MEEIINKIIDQAGLNGIFCLLFVGLLLFVIYDSHRREIRNETTNQKLLEIIEKFKDEFIFIKDEFKKISEILQKILLEKH